MLKTNLSTTELVNLYLSETSGDKAPETVISKRQLFDRILKFLNGREITKDLMVEWLDSLSCGNRSKHGYLKYIRAFTHWMTDEDYLDKNWGKKILLPKLDKTSNYCDLSPETVEVIIIAGTEPTPIRPRLGGDTKESIKIKKDMREGLLFSLCTALRFTELQRLTASDFNFDTKTFKVRPSKGQGTMELTIPDNQLVEMLKERCRTESGRLFKITNEGCNRALKRGAKKLGIPLNGKFTCHTLRHNWATDAMRRGIALNLIQRQLRHKSILVTASTYVHVAPRDLREVVDNNPIVRRNQSPGQLFDWLERDFKLKLAGDSRFTCEVQKSSKGLVIKVLPI